MASPRLVEDILCSIWGWAALGLRLRISYMHGQASQKLVHSISAFCQLWAPAQGPAAVHLSVNMLNGAWKIQVPYVPHFHFFIGPPPPKGVQWRREVSISMFF
jgi:hypothetical protein